MTNDEYQALKAIASLHAHFITEEPTAVQCDLAVSLYNLVTILAQDSRIVTEAFQQYHAWLREEEN